MANLFKSFLGGSSKPTLTQITEQLKEQLTDLESTGEVLKTTISSFFDAVTKAQEEEVNISIRSLSDLFFMAEESRSTTAMMICGYLIEQGYDPQLVSARIIEKLAYLTESAYPFYQKFKIELAKQSPVTDDEESDEEDGYELLEELKEKYWDEMTDSIISWNTLEQQYTPAVSVFSLDRSQCIIAENTLEYIGEMAEYNQGCYWLNKLFEVLHHEPIVIIEPSTSTGVIGYMSGVVDNFQLQALIMDIFPHKGSPRISKAHADLFKGIGPQSLDGSMVCHWNLYNWPVLTEQLSLPDATDYSTSTYWIWGEGKPADIGVLDGYRIVLLGETSYQRSTNLQRVFNHLQADILIEKELTTTEVRNWLSRMYQAAQQA
ncbi:hypothetical protein QNI16_29725 [Cytophagaceae bacterium YF14B1]|uniref:Uncharacterized protein n=1 Tax=Xanthocytophaga flava TaxID=3048013 RepID=A0AAE3QTL9_9BACT|nr:hypothetical protein [Xanthocytophaga flavus]MDJ1484716.1 hypothetical protein [Xanthocytophaga flavus]